jgi:dipeptidyl aminopeptidase/acylaminoacyl peptidase
MKKVILVITIMLATTAAFSQSVMTLISRSEEFFTTMQQEKFKEANLFFDESVQAKVPAETLQQVWTNLGSKLGKYESAEVVQSKTQGDFVVVIMDAKFANDTQRFLLAFNKTSKLMAFLLQPKSTAAVYNKPAYADTTLYKESEIRIPGTNKNDLVGLLTVPRKATNFPIVVLVHGSGPADMDATVGPNKPFKDLAVGLAAQGIASIRYVKRTLVYPMAFSGAFTVKEEVTDDAVKAIALAATVPGVDKKQIYLFGHSLGGMLAPKLATLAPDLKGIILAAAPARKLTDIIVEQNKYMFAQLKDTTAATKKLLDTALIEINKSKLTKLGTMKADSIVIGLPASYWIDLNNYDQVAVAKKLSKRILVVQGGNDFQISEQDFKIWNAALAKKSNATLKYYPELNHLLSVQTEKTDAKQYQIAANVSDKLINDVAAWIKAK